MNSSPASVSPLQRKVTEWVQQHITCNEARIPPVIQITIDSAGHENALVQEGFFKVIMWSFLLDDIYDDGDYSIAELEAITDYFREDRPLSLPENKLAVINDCRNIFQELLALVPGLTEHSQYCRYLHEMKDQVLTAQLTEAITKEAGTIPDFDQYLETGKLSVITTFIFPYVFYIIDKDFFTTGPSPLPVDLINISSEMIRLTNDKVSYRKELQENKKNNSLIILQESSTSPDSFNEAVQKIDQMVNERMLQVKQLVSSYQNESLKRFGRFVQAACEAQHRFYSAATWYHT